VLISAGRADERLAGALFAAKEKWPAAFQAVTRVKQR